MTYMTYISFLAYFYFVVFFVYLIYYIFSFFRIFALSVCRHVWLINITIFSVEVLPWNLIVQDHWRWGLSTDHI